MRNRITITLNKRNFSFFQLIHNMSQFWFCCCLCCLYCRSRRSMNKYKLQKLHLISVTQRSTNIQLCHFCNARPLQSNLQAFFFCRLLFFFKQSCIAYILIILAFPLSVWLHPLTSFSLLVFFFLSAITKASLTALQPYPHSIILWHTTFLLFSVSTQAHFIQMNI